MQGDIFIVGQIGSGQDETDGSFVRGVELVDVIAQFRAIAPDQKEVTIVIDSPGGYVETGEAIYNFLESKKKDGYKIRTIQRGVVGSIATKIFLAGDERIVNEAQEFFIHNPLVQNVTGDANVMQAVANQLQVSKDNLLTFYAAKTGNNKEALEPLMDSETSLSADQALALGFATKKENTQKIYATINKPNMDFKQLLAEIKAMLPTGVVPAPAQAPALAPVGMQLKLASGKMITTSAADAAGLKDSDTNAPDGEHVLEDGRTIVVRSGKIIEVKEASAPDPVAKLKEEFEAKITELANTFKEGVKAMKEANEKELADIKTQIVGKHTPPKKKENANQPMGGEKSKEWDELMMKDGAVLALKRENPAKYKELFVAKYGAEPNME